MLPFTPDGNRPQQQQQTIRHTWQQQRVMGKYSPANGRDFVLDVAVSGKVQEILKTISADDAKGTRREEKAQGIGELTMDDPADDDEYRNDERKAKFGETTLRTGSLMDQR